MKNSKSARHERFNKRISSNQSIFLGHRQIVALPESATIKVCEAIAKLDRLRADIASLNNRVTILEVRTRFSSLRLEDFPTPNLN